METHKARDRNICSSNRFLACWKLTTRGKSRIWTVNVLLLAHFFPGVDAWWVVCCRAQTPLLRLSAAPYFAGELNSTPKITSSKNETGISVSSDSQCFYVYIWLCCFWRDEAWSALWVISASWTLQRSCNKCCQWVGKYLPVITA